MEYLDVLNEEGNLTGEKKLRSNVHSDRDWHRLAFVWIMNSNHELLIQKRSIKKDANPGKWDVSCGGHVIAGDDTISTMAKEIDEELGIKISKESLRYLFSTKQESVSGFDHIEKYFDDVFLLEIDIPISKIKIQKEEVDEVKYVPWNEVENLILKEPNSFASREKNYIEFFKLLHKRFD